ncbi:MAG: ACP S-malonyltransferase [Syntrophales bacterium]|jgi:[acyl-carrier-protein] S-malonyltransferase|nr:ACP S-malonyltransferase [Syntrophales bacterium]MDY0044360.1 ACP S-malonyltransferase [Syntrophales bacterium]
MKHTLGIVFPGQGTQYVGMGKELYEKFDVARNVFSEAGEILKCDIARLCFEGPREALDMTENTQLAVLTVDLAAYKVFEERIALTPKISAGHSLGEYAALAASGAFSFADAFLIVRSRSCFMQEAVPPGKGAIAALIGIRPDIVEDLCHTAQLSGETVEPANYNGPAQIVISGTSSGVQKIIAEAKKNGAKRAVILPISIPCHSHMLTEAAARLEKELSSLIIKPCTIPVISNYNPDMLHSETHTRELLARQLNSPVRWQETIEVMEKAGADTIIEIGPGKTLSALIKRISPNFRTLNIEDLDSLDKAAVYLHDDA